MAVIADFQRILRVPEVMARLGQTSATSSALFLGTVLRSEPVGVGSERRMVEAAGVEPSMNFRIDS